MPNLKKMIGLIKHKAKTMRRTKRKPFIFWLNYKLDNVTWNLEEKCMNKWYISTTVPAYLRLGCESYAY